MTTLRPDRRRLMPGRLVARIRHRARIAGGAEVLIAIWVATTLLVGLPIAAVVGIEVHESHGKAAHQGLSDPPLVSVPVRWFAGGVQHAGEVSAPNHVGLPHRTVLDEAAAAALSTWLSVAIVAAIFLAGNWAVVQRVRDSRSDSSVLPSPESSHGGV